MLILLLSSTSKLKTVHLQGFCSKTVYLLKNRASSRLLAKNCVSQVFWDPIKNRVSPRSVLLKAVYLEALLYFIKYCSYLIVTVLDFEDRGRSRLLEFEKKIVLVI